MTLADAAIAWYDTNARDLPWRQPDTTPWGVLVSEVMLQQTPVVRVEPAWRSWMTRWPTPAALAADPASEAIRMWGRLGYPRRAMRLHACAEAIVERHGGRVPDDLDQLLALPGVGTYTARAVATFAYGQRHPVVDTNVRRVVCRAVEGKPDAGPATTAADLVAMEELLPADVPTAARASIAFMELGAIICTARSPKCVDCPFEKVCAWRATGAPLPEGPSRKPQRYAGTDRQVRGLILEVLRHATGPVPRRRLDLVWSDEIQRTRALAGLVDDGLVERFGPDDFVLPGDASRTEAQQL
ncbi:A/G-specific adenine glycosylase [Actinoplanes sp. OR16]|uniref:A/G-specific adenine glycosylase n=1 Tax=Actinoplanes sp. OR16 TaxID=946334 RepID=UPI000F6EBD5A|nr:A/G-specific adenine glycosylase [Actinoplanes sp. OR16]BBH65091.1 A/G-specific adenine glycosylase [Actinoplanes sp. OR16]